MFNFDTSNFNQFVRPLKPGLRLSKKVFLSSLTFLFVLATAHAVPPTMDPTYGLPLPGPSAGQTNTGPEAQWIWAANTANSQTIYTRAVVNLNQMPGVAQMSITADNYFTLYVNGQLVNQSLPDPQNDSVWKTVHRPVITPYLVPGPNVIAVVATNVDGPAGLIARLDGDGQALLLSDSSWKISTNSNLPADCDTTNYSDASWPSATVIADLGGGAWQMGLQGWPNYDPTAAYLAHLSLQPASVEVLPGVGALNGVDTLTGTNPVALVVQPAPSGTTNPITLVLDFGQEVAGRMQVTGPTGAQVQVTTGESREEAMLAGWAPPTLLTLEAGVQQHTPYLGFRYVKLAFFGNAPYTITNLAADFKYYPVEYKGSFDCSDPLLTQIWYTGAYTAHLCMQEDVFDGVKRDRLLWSGDLQVSGNVINNVFADSFLMEKDLTALRAGIQGGQPDTSLPQGEINSIPGYSAAWFCTLADFYRHVGDQAYLNSKHDLILSLLQYEQTDFDSRNIYTNPHNAWDFTDWSADLSCYSPTVNTDSAAAQAGTDMFIIRGVREAVFLLNAMGDTTNAVQYSAWADTLTAAARQYLVDTNTGSYTSRRQLNVMAVLSGVATTNQLPAIYNSVLRAGTPDWSNDLTPYYASFLLDAYSQTGHTEDGLDLSRSLWGNMLAQGATTFWERYSPNWRWAGPDLTLSPAGGDYEMSLCHAWSSGVTSWLTEQVLGVRPTSGGFQTAELIPDLGDLQWAEGTVPTPNGNLYARVTANGTDQTAHVDIPAGTTLDVGLTGQSVTVDGAAATPARRANGRVYVELVGPGSHDIASMANIYFNAFSTIQAVDFSGGSGGFQAEPSGEGGQDLGFLSNGDYVVFTNVDFADGASSFEVREAGYGGTLTLRLDSPTGPKVGTLSLPATGDWQYYMTATCPVSGASGMHNLYLMFSAGYNLEWFTFIHAGVNNLVAPADGGFETPNIGAGKFSYGPTGGPWTFSPHPADVGAGILANGSAFGNANAPEGLQMGFVQSTGWTSLPVTGCVNSNLWTVNFLGAQRSYQPGGGVQTLEIYADADRLGSVTPVGTNFLAYSVSGLVAPGTHTLKFQGTSVADNTVFIDQVQVSCSSRTELMPAGAAWKYDASGNDLGDGWRTSGFDDSAWPSGTAPLGYGLDGQATLVSSNGQITTYFRTRFTVTNVADYTNLTLRLLRDDGAVVYLNGTEVFRSNLPTNSPIMFNSLASSKAIGIDQTLHYFTAPVPAALLLAGTNVLAVEVHQLQAGGGDLNFDLALASLSGSSPVIPRLEPLVNGNGLTLFWPGDVAGFNLQSATTLAPPVNWMPVTNSLVNFGAAVGVSVMPTNRQQFFRLMR
jgi:alpha-L-rhamnosidase